VGNTSRGRGDCPQSFTSAPSHLLPWTTLIGHFWCYQCWDLNIVEKSPINEKHFYESTWKKLRKVRLSWYQQSLPHQFLPSWYLRSPETEGRIRELYTIQFFWISNVLTEVRNVIKLGHWGNHWSSFFQTTLIDPG
jgi:hypothetical protein